MTIYLLDTNHVSALLQDHPLLTRRIEGSALEHQPIAQTKKMWYDCSFESVNHLMGGGADAVVRVRV